MEKFTRLFDILEKIDEYKPKDDFLAIKQEGKWKKYSFAQYKEAANAVSYGLLQLGVKPGDRVASIVPGRPEWNIFDMGIQQVGAIHVPIYPTISEKDYKYILGHAQPAVIFVSGRDVYRKIESFVNELPGPPVIYAIKETEGLKHFDDILELGRQHKNEALLQQRKSQVSAEDLVTIIYTSGTTGVPKGVMLSHSNIINNLNSVTHIPPVGEEGRAVSYLPLCHIYERMLNYVWQYCGISVFYVENVGTIAETMREVKPHLMSTVPRLLEKIYDKIMINGRKQKGFRKNVFFWAVNLGLRYELGKNQGVWYNSQLAIARKLVFSKWHQALGNELQIIVSGGAALQLRLARVFYAAGITILEGYGLTETSPVISVNDHTIDGVRLGTVGPVVKGVEVKLNDDGEILTKGPCLMKGYYKEPELTAEAIDTEGWFHTGDIGEFVEGRFLKITGRKKEIFKTSLGKYISPELIENKFKESPFIDTLMVVGENQKFAAALIVPDFNHLKNWAAIKGIPYTTDEEMVQNPLIKKRIEKEVAKYNASFGDTEKIRRFELIGHEWTIDSGELTAKLSLRRKHVSQRYDDAIKKLFDIEDE